MNRSRSDHSRIPAMFGSDACFSYSDCVFLPFSMPCTFFLLAGCVPPGKRICCKLAFSNVVVRCVCGGLSVL